VLDRLRRLVNDQYGRAISAGFLIGIVMLSFVLIWRSARSDTVVLKVSQLDDPHVVTVYVGGQVNTPGLHSLSRGSRVADAIAAAGGLTNDGDTSTLGMAAPLRDADQIIVPTRPTPTPTASPLDGVDTPTVRSGGGESAASGIVNINTATESELETLPGIGSRLAERIVEHRLRNGPFRTVDDLEAIQGISQRMVDELRPMVTIGP
jgi:competence protein ComEA